MPDSSSPSPQRVALTDALLGIVAEHGLDRVSVREVAQAAGVSIGTVQHYFPTKDAMLSAAQEEVVRRIQARVAAVRLVGDVRRNLSLVLRELLPLDDVRAAEVRIQVAFAARAATAPPLAALQREVLGEVRARLAEAFAVAYEAPAGSARCRSAAAAALALADGLALHAVSSGGMPTRALTSALDRGLNSLVATR